MRQNARRLARGNSTPRHSLLAGAHRGVVPICQPLRLLHRSFAPDKLHAHLVAESGIEELGEMGHDLLLLALEDTALNGICLAPFGIQTLELINISRPDGIKRTVALLEHSGCLHVGLVGDDVNGVKLD